MTKTNNNKTRTSAEIKSSKIAIYRLVQPFSEVLSHADQAIEVTL